ncbi:hypothetical protein KC614_00800 [candidate division WWE3 bacterium]|uniref:O-antigen ligase-related domain-containing protein n=1 Tax=candidate division WWE3 bacterium TaxID=2053526 RepID=A0A955LJT9_UNCKA|nr:hypothetical protein [candidate division WWE3 bacterium]
MKDRLILFINKAIYVVMVVYFFLFPVYFLTNTSEFFSYNKIVLTVLTAVTLLILWSLRTIISRELVFIRTPFNLALILIAGSYILSTIFSVAPYTSIFGTFNSWHFTVVEMLSFIVIFTVAINTINTRSEVRGLLYAYISSAFIVAILAVMVYFNVFDGKEFSGVLSILNVFSIDGFSPAGNAPSLIIVMLSALFIIIYLLFVSLLKLKSKKTAINTIKSLTLVLIIFPVCAAMFAWLISYFPGVNAMNSIYQQLNFNNSWRIAVSSIREYPLWGTGPSTYSTAYNAFRPAQINQTPQWSINFNQAGSEYMTVLTTLGVFGLGTFAYFVYKVIKEAASTLRLALKPQKIRKKNSDDLVLTHPIVFVVLSLLLVFLFTSSTVTTMSILFMFLMLWVVLEKVDDNANFQLMGVSLANIKDRILGKGKRTGEISSTNGSLYLVVSLPALILAIFVGFYLVKDFRSNIQYSKSLVYINNNAPVKQIYDAQRDAINLNPRRTQYRILYASTNLRLAELLAQQSGENIDDSTQNDIAQLINQAMREVRVATELLERTSASAWQARGNLFVRLIGGVQDAFGQSKQAYEYAISLSPYNPVLRKSLGDLYQSYGTDIEKYIPQDQLDSTTDRDQLVKQLQQQYYVLSAQSYNSSLQLKPDYADAHFSLARLYVADGMTEQAKLELETTLNLLPADSTSRADVQSLLDNLVQ